MSDLLDAVDKWLRDEAERMSKEFKEGAVPRSSKVTVREFLAHFGYSRRGPVVVSTIREKLESHQLRTVPDFEYQYIDDQIALELDDEESEAEDPSSLDPAVRIGMLKAAHNAPVSVVPDDRVVKAITLMRMEDYSQLPVMTNGRNVKGMVSWRSIGRAYSNGTNPSKVRECMEPAHEVDGTTTLADATDQICTHDSVLVRGPDKQVTGIVTAADLAHQFKHHAHPFLLIGEIERRLRMLVRRKFTVDELAKASTEDKHVSGPGDLTFGGYCRLLQDQQSWAKLAMDIDRVEFIKRLEGIREIRNDFMHFAADGRDPDDIERLEKVVRFLRNLRL